MLVLFKMEAKIVCATQKPPFRFCKVHFQIPIPMCKWVTFPL